MIDSLDIRVCKYKHMKGAIKNIVNKYNNNIEICTAGSYVNELKKILPDRKVTRLKEKELDYNYINLIVMHNPSNYIYLLELLERFKNNEVDNYIITTRRGRNKLMRIMEGLNVNERIETV